LWSTTGAIILFAANIGTPALFIMIKRQAISPLLLPLYTKSFICEVMSGNIPYLVKVYPLKMLAEPFLRTVIRSCRKLYGKYDKNNNQKQNIKIHTPKTDSNITILLKSSTTNKVTNATKNLPAWFDLSQPVAP